MVFDFSVTEFWLWLGDLGDFVLFQPFDLFQEIPQPYELLAPQLKLEIIKILQNSKKPLEIQEILLERLKKTRESQ